MILVARRGALWAGALACVTVLMLLPNRGSFAQETKKSQSWEKYFPAAVGNTWSYWVREGAKMSNRTVTWKMSQADIDKAGKFLTIWETPKDESEGIQLLLSETGLQDIPTGFYLLKFPVIAGDEWTYEVESVRQNRKVTVRFKVVSSAAPCRSGKYQFDDCIVVDQKDPDIGLDIVTCYAKNVGPVKHVYSQLGADDKPQAPSQTLELKSFNLVSPKRRVTHPN